MQAPPQPSPVQVSGQYAPTSASPKQLFQSPTAPQTPHWTPHELPNNAVTSSDTVNSQPRTPYSPATMALLHEQQQHRAPVAGTVPISSTSGYSPANVQPNRPGLSDILGTPPVPPPRTSSNNRSHASPSTTSPADRNGSSKTKRREDRRDQGDRERSHVPSHRDRPKDDTSSSKPRRKAPPSPEGPRRAASTRERRDHGPSTMESRSEAAMGPSSFATGPTNEDSTITNRIVVTDPEVDIARERQRQAEAQACGSANFDRPESSDTGAGTRSRQDYSTAKHKETTFGEYILGQTLGEGEFGKVRLGWKRDGSVQVAIKLIRRDTLGNNPSRLPKIHREIAILRELSHPNIVRLHEMVETERNIGIILEYASGGELFDYILNHRYLKDNAARRLFAQLVSGVGYLHKKGIVHRDLKLENLLLDRNRNIIITDFGFANTFNPADDLSEEIEYNLTNREFVKRMRLDRPDAHGMRRGDLMQTSCGSPCYAAPELVVSDSLYTGRKVDVWSCGVILYAMLAGYLPFDDDPANPDGDNINLLYKYIVTTPLTFPEYVTPHARDLLRRILVPDPRKRADLFEVARHSWLAEYATVVSHITSNTTNVSDIANTTVPSEDQYDTPSLARSASVREPPKTHQQASTAHVGGLPLQSDLDRVSEHSKQQRDAKRRTVQVEYVAPQSQTTRGEPNSGSRIAQPAANQMASLAASRSKPLPSNPPNLQESYLPGRYSSVPIRTQGMPRPKSKDLAKSISELTGAFSGTQGPPTQSTRPPTSGSISSASRLDNRLPSRGSYSLPVAPAVATASAQGRLAQPNLGGKPYISAPIPIEPSEIPATSIGQPSTLPGPVHVPQQDFQKGHKRSSTVSSISEKLFGRPGSFFGGKTSQPGSPRVKPGKRYPPTSMKEPFALDSSRASMDSRRSLSNVFRKQSDTNPGHRQRRFSLLPTTLFSRNSTKEHVETIESLQTQPTDPGNMQRDTTQGQPMPSKAPAIAPDDDPSYYQNQEPIHVRPGSSHYQNQTASQARPESSQYQQQGNVGIYADNPDLADYSAQIDRQFASLHGTPDQYYNRKDYDTKRQSQYQSAPNIRSGEQFLSQGRVDPNQTFSTVYDGGYHQNPEYVPYPTTQGGRMARSNVLQKNNRKFGDAYEYDKPHHAGSSGAARKVMDFFRRRGKARIGEDR
ncbi:hypothetical protein LOZ58_001200 [Ophidiomyces ophidiicola]|nr:hypothetical protein LOZ58_001200 [Ophidiomyces ophidiicola]